MYQTPKKFFVRELLLLLIAFGMLVVSIILSGLGGGALVVALLINVVLLLAMIVMFFISVISFFRSLGDQSQSDNRFMHFVNLLFALCVMGGFLALYVILTIAGAVILLPFIA